MLETHNLVKPSVHTDITRKHDFHITSFLSHLSAAEVGESLAPLVRASYSAKAHEPTFDIARPFSGISETRETFDRPL